MVCKFSMGGKDKSREGNKGIFFSVDLWWQEERARERASEREVRDTVTRTQ